MNKADRIVFDELLAKAPMSCQKSKVATVAWALGYTMGQRAGLRIAQGIVDQQLTTREEENDD